MRPAPDGAGRGAASADGGMGAGGGLELVEDAGCLFRLGGLDEGGEVDVGLGGLVAASVAGEGVGEGLELLGPAVDDGGDDLGGGIAREVVEELSADLGVGRKL